MIRIPSWEEAERAVEGGNPTPLDVFIYENEPAGKNDELFREQLDDLVVYLCGLNHRKVVEVDGIVGKIYFVESPGFEGYAVVKSVNDDDTVNVLCEYSGRIHIVEKDHLAEDPVVG